MTRAPRSVYRRACFRVESPDFIDLGSPGKAVVSKGVPARLKKAAFHSSYRLHWTAVMAVLPAACAGLHTAVAQSTSSNDDTRWYIGAGVGLTSLQPDSYCDCMTIADDNDTSFNLYAGIDISKRFAVEFQISDLGSPSVDFLGEPVGSVDYQVAGLNGLLYLFNSADSGSSRDGLSAYIKAGAGVLINDSSLPYEQAHDTQLWLGAGIEYGFGRGWSLRTELNSFDTDARQVTASLVKRFGGNARYVIPDTRVSTTRLVVPTPNSTAAPIPEPTQPVAQVSNTIKPPEPSQIAVELPTVFFGFDQYSLGSAAQSKLNQLVNIMQTAPAMKLQLEGHADARGTVSYNNSLSMQRAQSVRDYLMSRNISGSRIEMVGYGELKPAADNASEAGRARNRRVEVHLYGG